MSVFAKDRAIRAKRPILNYPLMIVTTAAAIYFVVWSQNYIGVIFGLITIDLIIIELKLSDRTTYIIGLVPFIIAAILAYFIEWQPSPFGSHFHLLLALGPGVWWAIKYRKALGGKNANRMRGKTSISGRGSFKCYI